MENFTYINLLYAFAGLFIVCSGRLKALMIKKTEFSLGYWIKDNALEVFAAMVVCLVGIGLQTEFFAIFGLTADPNQSSGARSFIIGTYSYALSSYIITWRKDIKKK